MYELAMPVGFALVWLGPHQPMKSRNTPYFLADVRQAGGKMPEHRAVERRKEATMRAFTIDTDDNISVFASTERWAS